MEKFIVSARKYRPATFDTVVGQSSITTTLKNAIKSNHLAQAFLFCGPRGVGKTTCARILAKTINCANLSATTEACDECPSCVDFNKQQSLNIYELDAASNNSVDDIRGLVEQVRTPPHGGGKYKIYIIDEVHMLSTSAFNAFLKTLEEPPAYAIFILATTERHKILPTILSRCQIFDFNRIQIEDIANHLASIAQKENITADADALHIIAQKADGALRDSLSMFDQIVTYAGNNISYKAVIENLNILDYDYYFKMTDYLLGGQLSNALLLFNDVLNNGFDGHNFITGLSSHFRDLLVCKDEITLKLLEVSPNIRLKYKEQSIACSSAFLLNALDVVNRCDINYKGAKNQRLHVELALMKLSASGSTGVSPEMAEALKKKPDTVAAPVPPVLNHAVSAPVVKEQKIQYRTPGNIPGAKSVSISQMLNKTAKAEDVKPSELISSVSSGSQVAVSQEAFTKAWAAYVEMVMQQGKSHLASTLSAGKPRLENNIIHLIIRSRVQQEELNLEKGGLMMFLRDELENNTLSLNIELQVQEESGSPLYTDTDKFKRLIEKNPHLVDFKKALGLDFNG